MLGWTSGRVYTVGVCILIAFIAFPAQFMLLGPALGASWTVIEILGPFNLLVAMVIYNYYLAVTTDPGRVPADWEIPQSLVPLHHYSDESIVTPRFCKMCNNVKPPRTHHCRDCRRCVLKMDHHCPWINNCVGYFNYPHFLRFLFYVDLASGYIVSLLIWYMRGIFHMVFSPTVLQIVVLIVAFVLGFIVLFSVGILSGFHIYCLATNQTTIEGWEKSKVKRLIRKGKIAPVAFPYTVGIYRNICSVLGDRPLLWLWPKEATGDGLSFPVRPHTDPRLPYIWPPRDPDEMRNDDAHQMDSDSYYSESVGTDSEDDYSLSDEEQSIRRLLHHRSSGLPAQPVHYRQDQEPDQNHSNVAFSQPLRKNPIKKVD